MKKDVISRIVEKYEVILSGAEYCMEIDKHNSDKCESSKNWYEMILNFKTNFVDKLTREDIQHYRSVFVDDDVIVAATGCGKIFNKDKTVNVEYVKSKFQKNIDRILKIK